MSGTFDVVILGSGAGGWMAAYILAPVAHHTAGNFEHRVGQRKGADRPAPHLGANIQILLHSGSCDRDTDPVQVGNHRKQEQHAQDPEDPVAVFHALVVCDIWDTEATHINPDQFCMRKVGRSFPGA